MRAGEALRATWLSTTRAAVHSRRRSEAASGTPTGILGAVRFRKVPRGPAGRLLLLAALGTLVLLVPSMAALCATLPFHPTPTLPNAAAATARPREPAGTAYTWPLAPPHPVVRGFRPPATPYGAGHRGVDLAAPEGSPVLAAGAGVVVYAGPLAGRGVVSITHPGGLRTTYEPVTAVVERGEHVVRGTLIGHLRAGHPDCHAASRTREGRPACLHWGALRVRDGVRRYLNPLALVRAGAVRLLPSR